MSEIVTYESPKEIIDKQLRKTTVGRLRVLASTHMRKGDIERATALRAICDGFRGGLSVLVEALGASAPPEVLQDLSGASPEEVQAELAAAADREREVTTRAEEVRAQIAAVAAEDEERALVRSQPVPLVLEADQTLPLMEVRPYTEQEITAAIAEQSKLAGWHHSLQTFLPVMGLRVPTGDTVYAFSFLNRDYFQTSKDGFIKWIMAEAKLWPRAFFERWKEGKDGPQLKGPDDYASECMTMLECPESEGGPMFGRTDIQTSYFDPIKKQFIRAQCPLRKLVPAECPDFVEFLAVALPDADERIRFEDHLIATTDLSRPSAGVHITGVKRNAKSAVVEGVARLFGVKGATSGELFHHTHNDWVNPIVHEEEKPAKDERGEELTAAHRRNVITKQSHTINPKHVRQYVVRGYTRHWFTENGDRMFNFSGETEAELRATGERIDSFTFSAEAADWLEQKGGSAFVNPWIVENLIARHVLWLKQQREIVNKGSRMLVEGRLNKSVAMLQAQDRSAGRVLNCIARYVAYDSHAGNGNLKIAFQKNKHAHRAVVWGEGKIGVNANRLMENWQDVMGLHDRPPTLEVVRVVIDRYASEKKSKPVKIDGKSCRVRYLKVDSFLEYCHQYDIEDPEELATKIGAPETVVEGKVLPFTAPGGE